MLIASGAGDVTDGAPSEALKEISDLQEQWNTLNEVSAQRSDALDKVVPVTKEHEEKKAAFGQWVNATKPKVDDLDVMSVEEERLQEQEKAIEVSFLWHIISIGKLVSLANGFHWKTLLYIL